MGGNTPGASVPLPLSDHLQQGTGQGPRPAGRQLMINTRRSPRVGMVSQPATCCMRREGMARRLRPHRQPSRSTPDRPNAASSAPGAAARPTLPAAPPAASLCPHPRKSDRFAPLPPPARRGYATRDLPPHSASSPTIVLLITAIPLINRLCPSPDPGITQHFCRP